MSHDAPHAAAHCAEAAVSWIVPDRPVSTPPPESVLARIERAGPAALDDHEILAILGIATDAPTLDAAGGLRGLLDDPGDRLRPVVLPRADRVRAHAILEVHARWMEWRRGWNATKGRSPRRPTPYRARPTPPRLCTAARAATSSGGRERAAGRAAPPPRATPPSPGANPPTSRRRPPASLRPRGEALRSRPPRPAATAAPAPRSPTRR